METVSLAGDAPTADFSESALIRMAQQGDTDAFERLVRLHERGVLNVSFNVLRSREDARDAYQEVFLRVFQNLDRFRFQCAFRTWLYRITTNVCLDQLRRKGARKERITAMEPDSDAPDILDRTPDARAESNPDRDLAAREIGSKIGRALEKLSANERMVFELKHYEGLKLRTIGEFLSISEGAAKNCLFRATRKLRASLQGART